MVRRLLFLLFVVSLVAGSTLPASAIEADYTLRASCRCDWELTLFWTVDGSRNTSSDYTWGPFDCTRREPIFEELFKPDDANDIEVEVVLFHDFLSAECLLDKDFDHDRPFRRFRGSCSVDRCEIRFEVRFVRFHNGQAGQIEEESAEEE